MNRIMTPIRRVALKVVAHSWLYPDRLRPGLLRWCGATVGENVSILSGVRFVAPEVSIGRGSLINYDCVIDALWAPVTIGERVYLAPQVTIMTASHHAGPPSQRAGDGISGPVRIGAGSWLGLRCTVLPNVTIEPGCIIAAGAVVTVDCAANGLYAGVPARRIRDLATDGHGDAVADEPSVSAVD
jgi:maltose O-acetyltransferase